MHVELANLGHGVDEEGVVWVGERGLGEGFGAVEEGEGDLGVVFEAEEGGGEGDAVELEAWLGGVEGVVVLQEELRDQFDVAFVARWQRWEGAEATEEWLWRGLGNVMMVLLQTWKYSTYEILNSLFFEWIWISVF